MALRYLYPTLNKIKPAFTVSGMYRSSSSGGGEWGSGAGKGGGSGGSIRDAGGAFGKMEAAREEEFFRKLQSKQLHELKEHMDDEIEHHEKQIKRHKEAIERFKDKKDKLSK